MTITQKVISVAETADVCKVGRSTVGYWIRSKKITASRVGRSYVIPAEELLYFLKTAGRSIPAELTRMVPENPFFKKTKNCWEFWSETQKKQVCNKCIVFANQLSECFTINESECSQKPCHHCRYYLETYYPKIQLIYQFDLPAAMTKDLYLWGANEEFVNLCEVKENFLVGLGIEHVVHPDSLQTAISFLKKSAWTNTNAFKECHLFLKGRNQEKLEARIASYSLKGPPGVSLVLIEPKEMLRSVMHAQESRCKDKEYYLSGKY